MIRGRGRRSQRAVIVPASTLRTTGRRRRVRPTQQTVLVTNPRRRRRRRPRNRGPTSGGSRLERFSFIKDGLKTNSSGCLKFGPSLSDCKAFSEGILKAYHEYKIEDINLQWVSEASSTAEGSMAYEIDPHCKTTSISTTLNRFPITKGGTRRFVARLINGQQWRDASDDQFHLLYKGTGSSSNTAGALRISFGVRTQNPK